MPSASPKSSALNLGPLRVSVLANGNAQVTGCDGSTTVPIRSLNRSINAGYLGSLHSIDFIPARRNLAAAEDFFTPLDDINDPDFEPSHDASSSVPSPTPPRRPQRSATARRLPLQYRT